MLLKDNLAAISASRLESLAFHPKIQPLELSNSLQESTIYLVFHSQGSELELISFTINWASEDQIKFLQDIETALSKAQESTFTTYTSQKSQGIILSLSA